jgi:hypothetical protein
VRMPESSAIAVLDTGVDMEELERRQKASTQGVHLGDYMYGDARKQWLVQVTRLLHEQDLDFNVSWDLKTIRRIFNVLAVSDCCDDPIGCGAGFVSQDNFQAFLQQLTPSKFYAVFGEKTDISPEQQAFLQDLDQQLGSLLDENTQYVLWHKYLLDAKRLFVRVL